MGRNLIYGCMLTYQCNELDYPLISAVKCCMDVCDVLLVNDGGSTDGTLEILNSLKSTYGSYKMIIEKRKWVHDRKFWTEERNVLIDMVTNPNDYIFVLDADESIHENSVAKLRILVDQNVPAISFPVIHFYGRPTHYIEGDAWYKRHTRLWKKSTGIRLVHKSGGCADDVLWPDNYPAHLGRCVDSGIVIYHYGNCRDPRALGRKAIRADELYQNSTKYLAGNLPEISSFDYVFEKSGAKPFLGVHPKYIREWYETHKDQPTKFIKEGTDIKKLWCFA